VVEENEVRGVEHEGPDLMVAVNQKVMGFLSTDKFAPRQSLELDRAECFFFLGPVKPLRVGRLTVDVNGDSVDSRS